MSPAAITRLTWLLLGVLATPPGILVVAGISASASIGVTSRRTDWVISEVMYHPASRTDGRDTEFVEIHNAGLIAEDLGGHRLTGGYDFVFPSPTLVPAGGSVLVAPVPSDVEAVYQLSGVLGGFSQHLSNGGDTLRLLNPAGAVLLEVEWNDKFPWPTAADGDGNSLVLRRPSYGEGDPRAWGASTGIGGSPGTTESPSREPWRETDFPAAPPSRVVIHEIMYHPLSEDPADEYVELFNTGPQTVPLGGWRFTDGIEFEFPSDALIEGGGYVVVARNAAHLLATHPGLDATHTYGNFAGGLARSGERIAIASPDSAVVDEVTYKDGGQWGTWSDGGGSSLELVDPRSDNRYAGNWADSDESTRSEWTLLEATGVLDMGVTAIDQLQLLSLGAGEYLVDDIAVFAPGSANRVANGFLTSGSGGWTFEGTLASSQWEPDEGATDAGCLRVRAVGRGDTGANRIRTPLEPGLKPGDTATLRARVRWLRGMPEFLMRLRGNDLEAHGRLKVPAGLGTPGARNSRWSSNAPPAIADLAQFPVLPAAGEPVRVTAHVADPDGIGSVVLRYRIDPSAGFHEIPMSDDGSGGDPSAGDGFFTAMLPGQESGMIVAFQVVARDSGIPALIRAFPPNEALVRFGETQPPGDLDTYRLWFTQETFDRWTRRSKLDNSPLPVTFVYNDERVVHGVGALFAGSPHLVPGYTTPSGNLCGYVLNFPSDEPFLGATDVVLDWPGRDATAQQEPLAYWIARELGIPFNHRRYIHLHVNGTTEEARGSIYEDAQQVNGDLMASWNPTGTGGDLFKIEQWFEFSDAQEILHIGPPRLEDYVSADGTKKLARYRWNWLKRAVRTSASDYRSLFALVDAANTQDPVLYRQLLPALADIEEWMRIFAVEHMVVNFDSWGSDIGKNMYAYQPPGGPWRLYMWDIDWVMLASAQYGFSPQSPLMYRGPAVVGEVYRDPVVGRMYDEPAFQRAYWRAVEDAVHGPLEPARLEPRLDAIHEALVSAGVSHSAGLPLQAPTDVKSWLRDRREFLLGELAAVAAPFSIEPPPATVTDSNVVMLAGTAPIAVRNFQVNGRAVPVTWTQVTAWSMTLALQPGLNAFTIQGLDGRGLPTPGAEGSVSVRFDGEPPVGLPIRILDLAVSPGGTATVSWSAEPGIDYDVQVSSDPAGGGWSSVGTPVSAVASTALWVEIPPAGATRRFYRVVARPAP